MFDVVDVPISAAVACDDLLTNVPLTLRQPSIRAFGIVRRRRVKKGGWRGGRLPSKTGGDATLT
ncbi:MAG: hypothetical protein PGN16_15260 [Sphingomonas phyllosphaerae]|uniref:hypothetical protein n=1 Tax=Sphingomonas phyllosphaerae TaxID=257003 RepID=UPI002FF6B742